MRRRRRKRKERRGENYSNTHIHVLRALIRIVNLNKRQ